MMPRALREVGLLPALEDLLDYSLPNANITHKFEHFGIEERLPEMLELTLFRVSQELIHNVIKHSGASECQVQVYKAGSHVMLLVEDNGHGFDAANTTGGIGLQNITGRVEAVNGSVRFEPGFEAGTLATIKVPLPA